MSDADVAVLRTLANALRDRAAKSSEAEVGATLNERIADTLDLTTHGEHVIAFENLAQNVYEFDVPLTQSEFQFFGQIGQAFRLEPDSWTFLSELVTPNP